VRVGRVLGLSDQGSSFFGSHRILVMSSESCI
jgi:hypothetical protein